MNTVPITELVLNQLDAVPGLDRLESSLGWLEQVYGRWQDEGAASNFPLVVVAATPCAAIVLHSAGWPEADDVCKPDIARQVALRAIERRCSGEIIGVIGGFELASRAERPRSTAARCGRSP